MPYVDFMSVLHKATKRDYIARVLERPKAEVAKIAATDVSTFGRTSSMSAAVTYS